MDVKIGETKIDKSFLFYWMYAHLGESIVFEIQVCAELTAGRAAKMDLVAAGIAAHLDRCADKKRRARL